MNNIRERSFYRAEPLCFLAQRFFFASQDEREPRPDYRL